MKKIILLVLLSFVYVAGHSQIFIFGQVRNPTPDTMRGVEVYLYEDTSGTPIFPFLRDTTDVLGDFTFTIPDVPVNTRFYLSTVDCDGKNMKIDTIVFTGLKTIRNDLVVCSTFPENFSGRVMLGSTTKHPDVAQSMVYLIRNCNNTLTYIDSMLTGTDGLFEVAKFPQMQPGCELILHARLTSSSRDYKNYLPAYRVHTGTYALKWLTAKAQPKFLGLDTVNIFLPRAQNPNGGPSIISGFAVDDAAGDPLPGKKLMITDMHDVPVDYTHTDKIGSFSFPNLQFGTYKVFGDVWNKDNPDLVVNVSADHVHEPGVIFTDWPLEFKGIIVVSVRDNIYPLTGLKIYPNPVQDKLYISGVENIAGDKEVMIQDISGKLLRTMHYNDGMQIAVPFTEMLPGVYMVTLLTQQGKVTYKVVK